MPFDAVRAKTLFLAASDLTAADLANFLDRECGTDAALRARVESLLAANSSLPSPAPPYADSPETGAAPSPEYSGMLLAGKYKLLESIGEGGMGSVWLAQQVEPVKRKVAVKLIKLGMDSRQVLGRFEAERQALAMMEHPNIAKVLDGGLAPDGRPFFVMELVKGVPITDYCDACKLGVRERLDLFLPVCHAIQHAHQKGIIHRDIKPSNVMIALYDDQPVPKVIDFGVAKATGAALSEHAMETRFGGVVGTPHYMSPEQATLNNLDIDTRSDVYSLGVLLYELLTGSPPFSKAELDQKGLMEVLRVVREDEPPKPSTRISTAAALPTLSANRNTEPRKLTEILRSELDWIVLKALEKNRARRYETANGLAADVQRYLAGDPVAAHPPTATYRAGKFIKKHRLETIAASAVVAALLLGIAGTAWQARRAAGQRDLAVAANERERQQRVQAETERDKAAKIAEFISETLQGAGPSRAKGRDIQMLREMMDSAAARIEKGELKAAPEAELRLRDTIGVTYMQLALFADVARMFEPAVPLARATHAGDHLDVAHAVEDLAQLRQIQGDLAAAEPLFIEALDMYKRLYPNGDQWVAVALNNLASNYQYRGNQAAAEKLFRESLAVRRQLSPGDSEGVAAALSNLAQVLIARADFKGAEQPASEALAMRKRLFTGDHPEVASSLQSLGNLLDSSGELVGAESYYRDALAMETRLRKGDHPTIVHALGKLGGIRQRRGDLDQAESFYRECLAMVKRLYPKPHSDVAGALGNLATLLQARGDLAGAEPLYRESLQIDRQLFPGDHYQVAGAINNLGFLMEARQEFVQAEAMYRESLEMFKRLYPQDHPSTAQQLGNLGHLFQLQGDLVKARSLYQESLDMYRRLFPSGHPDVARSMNNLAGVIPPQESEPLAREAVAMFERIVGKDHWSTGNARVKLGRALAGLGRFKESETELLEAQRVIFSTEGGPPTLHLHVVVELGNLYRLWDEAEPGKGYDAKLAEWKAKALELGAKP